MEVSVKFRHFAVALALAVTACAPAKEPAAVVGLPQTVVLFAPSMTEAACALGYGERIVAITDYDRWPPEILDRPRIGGALDPDLERLAVLQPDLLVLQGENEQLRQFAVDAGLRIGEQLLIGVRFFGDCVQSDPPGPDRQRRHP